MTLLEMQLDQYLTGLDLRLDKWIAGDNTEYITMHLIYVPFSDAILVRYTQNVVTVHVRESLDRSL